MFVPRPILKRCSASVEDHRTYGPKPQPQPRTTNCVRFPPSPTLTRTFSAHSPSSYDRSPIVVLPNTCALPARGCPGRTYLPGDPPRSPNSEKKRALKNKGKSFHPRVVETSVPACSAIPSLTPDVSSSESDESDGFTSPSPHSPASFATSKTAPMTPAALADALDSTLSFLPHAPTSQLHKHHEPEEEHQYHTYEEEKRRRRERTRWEHDRRQRMKAHESARELEHQTAEYALEEDEVDEDDDDDTDLADAPAARYKSFCTDSALSGLSFADPDDGCLGGF